MAASTTAPRRGPRRDLLPSSHLHNRERRDVAGVSVGSPDWPPAPAPASDVLVVLHVPDAGSMDGLLEALAEQAGGFDLVVVSPEGLSLSVSSPAARRIEVLEADPVGDGLYQLAALANSGRLTGYRTIVRHAAFGADAVERFRDLLRRWPLAVADRRLHVDLTIAGLSAATSRAAIDQKTFALANQVALRTNTKLRTLGADQRSLATIVIRGALLEALATLRVDHQDFYETYFHLEEEGHATQRVGTPKLDPRLPRALEIAYLALLDHSGLALEPSDAVGPAEDGAVTTAYLPRAALWAVYHPDLTHRVPSRDATWPRIMAAGPMYRGQHSPPAPVGRILDPESASDRAAQTAIARQHGVTGFLVVAEWDESGIQPEPFFSALAPREDFPWALVLQHPIRWAVDPAAHRARQSLWPDPGTASYAALAASVAELTTRGAYLEIDGRPVVLVRDLEMLDDAEGLVAALRAAAPKPLWVGVVEGQTQSTERGVVAYPAYVDGIVGIPPSNSDHRMHVRVDRINGYSGRAINLSKSHSDVPLAARIDADAIPGVMVGFDTTPYLRSQGVVGFDWNVFAFRRVLDDAVRAVAWKDDARRIVVVNSWNGWSDLSQLEPGHHRGRSHLSMIDDVMSYPAN